MYYKWLTNTFDPRHKDARHCMIPQGEQTQEEAWADFRRWLNDKAIMRPRATEHYTVEQLESKNMVGVYAVIPEPTP